jgi:hypothetical protein
MRRCVQGLKLYVICAAGWYQNADYLYKALLGDVTRRISALTLFYMSPAEKLELELAQQVSLADHQNLQLYSTWGQQPPASASFKVDGSLVIAFVWQGELYTCTRRRMTSERVGPVGWGASLLEKRLLSSTLVPQ